MSDPSNTPTPLWRIVGDLFRGRERLLLATVFGVSVVAALFETIGVASILPFMSLVLDPSGIDRSMVLQKAMALTGVKTREGGLIVAGIATVFIVAFGNVAAAVDLYVQQRFRARTDVRFSSALFSRYMAQPYSFHVRRDAPSLLKVLNVDIGLVINGVLVPSFVGASKLLMSTGILLLLVIKNPAAAVIVTLALTLTYASVFRVTRAAQTRLAASANRGNEVRARIAQEALGGVKELLVLGRSQSSNAGFSTATGTVAQAYARHTLVARIPGFVLETTAFGGILIASLALKTGAVTGSESVIPLLVLYAFAGYRLLPALQQVFASAVSIRFHYPALRTLHADLAGLEGHSEPKRDLNSRIPAHLPLRDKLRLEGVSLLYEGAETPSLRDVTLEIPANKTIGIIGRTGSGKTTLVDVILGLFPPSAGRFLVDGIPLAGERVAAWQRSVGYVPQHIFLANASVAENIAFGLPSERIDFAAVRRAAALAQAEEFVLEMPAGYDTVIGERGVRLSGGQRQRLGLARALYHDPSVIVLDEATSALDGLTEEAVVTAIESLAGQRTVIVIAHRLRSVERCDMIILLDRGHVVAAGTFGGLVQSSQAFRAFVGGHGHAPAALGALAAPNAKSGGR